MLGVAGCSGPRPTRAENGIMIAQAVGIRSFK